MTEPAAGESAGVMDGGWIERLRSGDPAAVQRFLDTYQQRIFSFGMMVCGHREDAEDIAQLSLVSALHSVRQLRSAEAFHVWLYRIVRHACYRQRRKHQLLRHATPLQDLEAQAGSVPTAPGSEGPEAMLLRDEVRDQLQRAVATLSAPDRLVLLLRDFENLSTEEVARVMGLGVSAVKMRLHRARLRVRRELEAHSARPQVPKQ